MVPPHSTRCTLSQLVSFLQSFPKPGAGYWRVIETHSAASSAGAIFSVGTLIDASDTVVEEQSMRFYFLIGVT